MKLRVVVKPVAFLVGKVLGSDGKPSANAAVGWLTARDPADKSSKAPAPDVIALTSPDGTFRLGPVPEGEYVVTGLVNEPGHRDRDSENGSDRCDHPPGPRSRVSVAIHMATPFRQDEKA